MLALVEMTTNRPVADRDLLIDQMNDMITNGSVTRSDQEIVVEALLKLILRESDEAVSESIWNLLGNVYEKGPWKESIADAAVTLLDLLPAGCLAHVIPIIGGSNRHDKHVLLAPFTASSNNAIRAISKETLQITGGM